MTNHTDPTDMSRDERIGELACILAQGVARVKTLRRHRPEHLAANRRTAADGQRYEVIVQ